MNNTPLLLESKGLEIIENVDSTLTLYGQEIGSLYNERLFINNLDAQGNLTFGYNLPTQIFQDRPYEERTLVRTHDDDFAICQKFSENDLTVDLVKLDKDSIIPFTGNILE